MLLKVSMMGLCDECHRIVGFVAFSTKQSSVQQSVVVRHWILCYKYQRLCCMTMCMKDPLHFECECWIGAKWALQMQLMINFTFEEFVPIPLPFVQTFQPEAYPVWVDYCYWIVQQHWLLVRVSVCDDVHFTWDRITSGLKVHVCLPSNLGTCFDLLWSPICVRWGNQLCNNPCLFILWSWNVFWFVMRSSL